MEYCMKNGLNPNDPHNWKVCNYYTDFWIELQDSNDPSIVKRIFIEVKPFDQTQCPKPLSESASLKERKAFNKAAETYLVNQQKWSAAKKYFNERGADFMVITVDCQIFINVNTIHQHIIEHLRKSIIPSEVYDIS